MPSPLKTYPQTKLDESPWSFRQKLAMQLWQICWGLFCGWTPKPLNAWRLIWLKLFGATIHGRPFVHQHARVALPWNLILHHRACLGDRTNVYSLGEIEIHEGATVAQEVYLCTGTHEFKNPVLPLQTAKITIGANAFIGARAFVLPGVIVGANAIVGACAVVTCDVPENSCVIGNPARIHFNISHADT